MKAALVVVAACGGAELPPARQPMTPSLSIQLLASPTRLSMAERTAFSVGVAVTNRGTANVDPELVRCTLTVNGKRSMSWSMAIGNGARESSWYDLPPGQTATMSWPLGDELFDEPGHYHLVMALGDQEAAADVTVTR